MSWVWLPFSGCQDTRFTESAVGATWLPHAQGVGAANAPKNRDNKTNTSVKNFNLIYFNFLLIALSENVKLVQYRSIIIT
jgi:hypothetical protein